MNLLQKIKEKIPIEFNQVMPENQSSRAVIPLTIGECEDGLPICIDLNDPQLEPIAILSDNEQANQLLFTHLLIKLTEQQPGQNNVQFALLKRKSSHWPKLLTRAEQQGTLLNVEGINPHREWEFLYQAAEIAENRHQGTDSSEPPIILLIEDLSILANASSDFRLNFEWLIQFGSEVGIHFIVAATTRDALKLGRWLRFFTTRIIGPMPPANGHRFGLHDPLPNIPRRFQHTGTTFAVWNQTDWLHFLLKPQDNF